MCTADDRYHEEQYLAAMTRYAINIGATAKVKGWNENFKLEVTADIMIQSDWSYETTAQGDPGFEQFGLAWFEDNCELEKIAVHSNHIVPDWVDGEGLTNVQKRALEFNWDLDDYGQEY